MMIKSKIGDFFRIISIDKQDRIQIRKCDGSEINKIERKFKAAPEWDCYGEFEKFAAQRYQCVALICIDPVTVVKTFYGTPPQKLIHFLQNIDRLEIEEFCIPSDVQNLSFVSEYIAAFMEKYRIRKEFHAKIEVAVTEAVINAIIHGNEQDANKNVTISLSVKCNVLTAIVKDEGKGFDFTVSYNDPTRPETITKESGRGLYLINCLSDKLTLEDNGSKVVMEFNLKLQNGINGKNNP